MRATCWYETPHQFGRGADYYITVSSFDSYPGLTIWHGRDLVNWQPRKATLTRNIGSAWAVSLEKHNGRYFLYIPVEATPNAIDVIWSDPIDLDLPTISIPATRSAVTDRAGCSCRGATGHMVIVARSRSIHGPWTNDPANSVVRTVSTEEK